MARTSTRHGSSSTRSWRSGSCNRSSLGTRASSPRARRPVPPAPRPRPPAAPARRPALPLQRPEVRLPQGGRGPRMVTGPRQPPGAGGPRAGQGADHGTTPRARVHVIASPLLLEDGHRGSSGGRLGVTFAGVSEHLPTGSPEISRAGLVLAYDMRTLTPRGALKDLSGRGNDGTLMGTELVEGPFGLARGFRDASDYVGLPFDRKLHIRGPISLAAWVRFAQLGVHQHIVAYDDLYTLWIDENDRFRFSDTRGDAFESDPRVVPVGEWAALVATFSGRRGTPLDVRNISIYVNGARAPGRAFGVWNP